MAKSKQTLKRRMHVRGRKKHANIMKSNKAKVDDINDERPSRKGRDNTPYWAKYLQYGSKYL